MTNEGRWIASFTKRPKSPAGSSLSDLEALRLRQDVRTLPLHQHARSLLNELPSLGLVDYTTGNSCVSCTRREQVKDLLPSEEGTALFGERGTLRWLDRSWRHSVAVLNRGQDFTDTPPCLLLYGETGRLAHQITLWDPQTWEGFIDLVCRHKGCWDCLRTMPSLEEHPRAEKCPVWLLREAWSEAVSEQDLNRRLDPIGLKRSTVIRALEGLFTTSIGVPHLASMIQDLAESGLSVHVQLGNRHCTQVLESQIESFHRGLHEWEIRLDQTTLTLDPAAIGSTWFVTQPQTRAERPRFECYDLEGEQVLTLSGPEEPCPAVQQEWQRFIGRFEAQHLH